VEGGREKEEPLWREKEKKGLSKEGVEGKRRAILGGEAEGSVLGLLSSMHAYRIYNKLIFSW
jgi:hypothetical protein